MEEMESGTSTQFLPVCESVRLGLSRPIPDIWAMLSEVKNGEFPDPPDTDDPATEIETGAMKPSISGEIETIPELMDADSGIRNVIVSGLVPSKLKDVLLELVSVDVIIDCQPKWPKPESEESLAGNDQSSDPSLSTSILGSRAGFENVATTLKTSIQPFVGKLTDREYPIS